MGQKEQVFITTSSTTYLDAAWTQTAWALTAVLSKKFPRVDLT